MLYLLKQLRTFTHLNAIFMIILSQSQCSATMNCGDNYLNKGRYYDSFMLTSNDYYRVTTYSNVFQCDNECKSSLNCTGISFDKKESECKFFNLKGLKTFMESKKDSSVILYMPITCPPSRVGAWSAWSTVEAIVESSENSSRDGKCYIKHQRICEEIVPNCIVDICDGNDVKYVAVQAQDAQTLLRVTKTGMYCLSIASRILPVYIEYDIIKGRTWLHIQRRVDGSVDFNRNWYNYTNGFGNLVSEFWLGNKIIHELTKNNAMAIRFDMSDGITMRFAFYGQFVIADEDSKFKLTAREYSGDARDSFSTHKNADFSTFDIDNDERSDFNCAHHFKGGWWYKDCLKCNANGLYLYGSETGYGEGISWRAWKGDRFSLKNITMKIRIR